MQHASRRERSRERLGPQPSSSQAVPRWAAAVTLVLCALGTAVAGYLTYAHFTTPSVLACPDTGIVNCAKVTTSSYSSIFGVPVAVAGLVFFVGMGLMCTPGAWRSSRRWLRALRLVGACTGMVVVLWLIYVELFRLDAICLYCTTVHALTLLLFATILLATSATAEITADGSAP